MGVPTSSIANPTTTFIVADTAFGDSGGQFVRTQAEPAPPVSTANIPTLSEWSLFGLMAIVGILAAGYPRGRAAWRPVPRGGEPAAKSA